jgi:DNA-binding transcriptional ArsR family regulator
MQNAKNNQSEKKSYSNSIAICQSPEKKSLLVKTIANNDLQEMAECLKTLAHPVRLKLVDILTQGDFPVYTLAEICNKPHNQVCAHLRLMKKCNLIGSVRKSRTVFYYIKCKQLKELLRCMKDKVSKG